MSDVPLRWTPAYIGLGANLDSPRKQIGQALSALSELPESKLIAVSPFYRSAPMGPPDQPDYINAAASLLTLLPARDLLAAMQAIEHRQGRRRDGQRWGPRTIDLDLLVYGNARMNEPGLTLPHPGIAERNFVLFPLRDIAPGLVIPGLASVKTLASAADVALSTLERLDDRP